jgi:hypothetical protein
MKRAKTPDDLFGIDANDLFSPETDGEDFKSSSGVLAPAG